MVRSLLAVFACALLIGCAAKEAPMQAKATQQPPMPAPAQVDKEDEEQLARLQSEYKYAKAAHVDKGTAETKKALVDSTVRLGTATMSAVTLSPKEKYPRALELYREALKLDPENKEAAGNKKLIEDIYKSMGRPVPGA